MYALYLQLNLAMLVCILLKGITDIKRLLGLNELGLTALAESNAVENLVRQVVDKFKFYMLLTATYNLTCSVIAHIVCTEERFGVMRTMRIELLEVIEELAGNLVEADLCIDFHDRRCLLRQDILRYKFFEALCKGLNIFNFQ